MEVLTANIEGELCMAHVARECELSVSYFVRAFKQTMGIPPYRWLTEQRIRRAKELLLHPGVPMADIAIKCGFADQACFIRAFKRNGRGYAGGVASSPSGALIARAAGNSITCLRREELHER